MLLCEPGYQTTVFLVRYCYVNQEIGNVTWSADRRNCLYLDLQQGYPIYLDLQQGYPIYLD